MEWVRDGAVAANADATLVDLPRRRSFPLACDTCRGALDRGVATGRLGANDNKTPVDRSLLKQ